MASLGIGFAGSGFNGTFSLPIIPSLSVLGELDGSLSQLKSQLGLKDLGRVDFKAGSLNATSLK